MNSNRRVLLFVVYSVVLYLLVSILGTIFHVQWMPFKRINLISDIVTGDSTAVNDSTHDNNTIVIEKKAHEDFNLYLRPRFITSFNTDTTEPSLRRFMQKLYDLKNGKKGKVRIAYFGDSMIEGDLLTQTLRKLLQDYFGGSGVGFVPITSQVSKFRQSVTADYSGGWQDDNFKNANTGRLYLSGHLFRGNGDWVQMNDHTITDSLAIIEKSLICGPASGPVNISVNNAPFTVRAAQGLNRVPMLNDGSHQVRIAVSDPQLPVYGISFESASGVFVDNFSFRGITGIEFAKIDSAFLTEIAANNPYDLIVFQYGVNLLFRPNDKNFNWYARALMPIVKKFRNCFPASDFLLVSTADRAFRYGGEYRSAIGIDSLIRIQATLAYETGSCFYNQFASMGGTNSIVDWAQRNPSLANKDYVHPNHRGAEVLGEYMFRSMLDEYEKYKRTLK